MNVWSDFGILGEMRTKKRVDDVAMLLASVMGPESPVELKNMVILHHPISRPDLALPAIQLLVRRWDGNYWDYSEADAELQRHVFEMC